MPCCIDINFSETYKKGTLTELSFSYVNEEFKQEALLWHERRQTNLILFAREYDPIEDY